ncbi:hypothetical protein [Kamptonema formosum]|uniref:hypothetical protein n=1 Tax=Kamptonema formosum TaxID=331992 RepID=UPI00034B1023|nr:hypothetical protein [Oscillatoria sp. PCC 10802]
MTAAISGAVRRRRHFQTACRHRQPPATVPLDNRHNTGTGCSLSAGRGLKASSPEKDPIWHLDKSL